MNLDFKTCFKRKIKKLIYKFARLKTFVFLCSAFRNAKKGGSPQNSSQESNEMDTKDRIQMVMKAQGMTQQEFSSALGISPASLSNIYTGRTSPTHNHVRAIHKRFPEINVLWLMFGEGEMYASEEASNSQAESSQADNADKTPEKEEPVAPIGMQGLLFDQLSTPTPAQVPTKEVIKIIDKMPPARRITEIRIFFDDGTFETFSGHKDLNQY